VSLPLVDVDLNMTAIPLVWESLFGRGAPTQVEIGAGKGSFLLELARLHPEWNLLAVERAGRYHALCCQRAAKRGLGNLRFIRTTAEDLLLRLLDPGTVSRFYVLFPDPWPKKRHHKRRLFKPENLAAMAKALVAGGELLVKSDHLEYASIIEQLLRSTPGLEIIDPTAAFAELPLSGFERKYRDQDRTIHAFAARRVSD
jgi:tRNA (guanine-N7-)-methyltransferase